MEAEAVLVGTGRSFLRRMGGHQGGVEVEDEAPGRIGEFPHPRTDGGPGFTHAAQVLLVQARDETPGGGIRGHHPEEHLLVAQSAQVAERIAAVGQHDPEVAQDLSRFVPSAAKPQVGEGRDQRARESHPIGHPPPAERYPPGRSKIHNQPGLSSQRAAEYSSPSR